MSLVFLRCITFLITTFISTVLLAATTISQYTAPQSVQTSFHKWLQQGMSIQNFDVWLFRPGALFSAADIWWPTKTGYKRSFPHEGMDFYFYQEKTSGNIKHVDSGTVIPLIYSGMLKAIFKDFIGNSYLFATNNVQKINNKLYRFYILYAHVQAKIDLEQSRNKLFNEGEQLLFYPNQVKNFAPSHLHVSFLWVEEGTLDFSKLSWDLLEANPNVIFVNPIQVSKLPI